MKRVAFNISELESTLVTRLAKSHGIERNKVLRLAVWAYVLPLVPTLPAPVPPLKVKESSDG